MSAEHVRQEIETAFGNLPVPAPKALIHRLHPRDQREEDQIRDDLAGRKWQSLTPDFLQTRWAAYCYLTPEAYRYYLPALLTAALEVLPTGDPLAHAVVFALRPSFWALYYEDGDTRLDARQAVLSHAQYRTVTTFLGHVFDRSVELRHLAAQALYWGWSRLETPAVTAAREYYRGLHHFTAPPFADPVKARLAEQIQSAFAETPYPGDHELCGSRQGDEPAEYAMELRGQDWRTLHPDFLAHNSAALSFLTADGFRYFLPAFLLADLAGHDSNADPVFHLTHGFATREAEAGFSSSREGEPASARMDHIDWQDYSTQRFADFTRPERLAIVAYLEHRAEIYDYDAARVEQALDRYWRPSVEPHPAP